MKRKRERKKEKEKNEWMNEVWKEGMKEKNHIQDEDHFVLFVNAIVVNYYILKCYKKRFSESYLPIN